MNGRSNRKHGRELALLLPLFVFALLVMFSQAFQPVSLLPVLTRCPTPPAKVN